MPMHSMIRTLSLLAALAPAGHAAEAPTIAAGGVVLWATADGTLHASGDAESGRGDADGTPRRHFAPVAGVRDVVAVAVQRDGDDGAAALDRRGTVWVWGRVFCPFAATREACAADDRAPRAVPGLSDIVAIAAGSEHLLALDRAGRVIAIGDNQYGQLGTGDTEWRRTATAIDGIDEVVAIAAGTQNSYFVRRDGSIWGAGLGWGGMLGPTARSGGLFDGLDEKSVNAQPLRIAGPEDIVAISAGNNFVVARDRDGRVWGWGGNDSAQLGQPASDLGIVAPRRLRGFEAVVDVAAGYDFVVAATEAGTILAQGGNVYGALGDGRGELDGALRTIEGIDDARRVFAGHYNAFALRADGSMLGWGANDPEVGGFTLRHDEGRAPPTPLDAVERPAAPSDIVRAGGVSLAHRFPPLHAGWRGRHGGWQHAADRRARRHRGRPRTDGRALRRAGGIARDGGGFRRHGRRGGHDHRGKGRRRRHRADPGHRPRRAAGRSVGADASCAPGSAAGARPVRAAILGQPLPQCRPACTGTSAKPRAVAGGRPRHGSRPAARSGRGRSGVPPARAGRRTRGEHRSAVDG